MLNMLYNIKYQRFVLEKCLSPIPILHNILLLVIKLKIEQMARGNTSTAHVVITMGHV